CSRSSIGLPDATVCSPTGATAGDGAAVGDPRRRAEEVGIGRDTPSGGTAAATRNRDVATRPIGAHEGEPHRPQHRDSRAAASAITPSGPGSLRTSAQSRQRAGRDAAPPSRGVPLEAPRAI
ncbi:MAG: hypothetical protein AVDCRST_MAG49-4228, partial [uncultured Thermomicrobiales bacterium]